MAHTSGDSVSHKDFFSKSEETRAQIHLEFDRLIEQINTRRNELLLQLDEAVSRYTRLTEDSQQAFTKLEELKQSSRDILDQDLFTGLQDRVLSDLNDVTDGIMKEISNLDVSFEWNDDIEEMIPDLGTLILNIDRIGWNSKPLATIDYQSKKNNLESKHTRNIVLSIKCVCIDQNSSKLYVAGNDYAMKPGLCVLNLDGHLLFQFGKDAIQNPEGIAVHKDKLYVSQSYPVLLLRYRIHNEGVPKRIITPTYSRHQLSCPGKLAIDESNGDVYVCDSGNDMIVRFNKFLGYLSHIPGKNTFSPLDVKITETRLIILAKEPNAYPIRFYTKEDPKPVSCLSLQFVPQHFDIDTEGNILISTNNKIGFHVFNSSGHLLHSLGDYENSYFHISEVLINKTDGKIFIFHGNSNLTIF